MHTRVFLVWVFCCTFVTVGAATYIGWDHGLAILIVAWIAGLVVGLAAAFGIPAAVAKERSPVAERAGPPTLHRPGTEISAQLAAGESLRAHLEQAISDGTPNGAAQLIPEIDSWIAATQALLDDEAPEAAHFFRTDTNTAEPIWPPKLEDAINLTQSSRLDRHLERLKEILVSSRS